MNVRSFHVRVTTPVTIEQARERLIAYRKAQGPGPWPLSWLADAVWPGVRFGSPQGAARAVSFIAKKVGARYWSDGGHNRGYMLDQIK